VNLPGQDKQLDYLSTRIGLIIRPHIPTVHMNTRYLATSEGWFGGGVDLTPMLPEQRSRRGGDAPARQAMRSACDAHDAGYYSKFKTWADEYFVLPHHGQARVVGGICYDHLDSSDFAKDFAFTQSIGRALLDIYPQIVRRRMAEPWTEEERQQQLVCRGLYAEF
jgi:coproporphyrinogen III oxidase